MHVSTQDAEQLAAVALPQAGFAWYAAGVLRGKVQPDRVSWLLWAVAPLIAFAAGAAQHAPLRSTAVTLSLGAGPCLVLAASAVSRHGAWKLTWLDVWCGYISAIALELWYVTGRGSIAIALAILADALAAMPTVAKSWSHPSSESIVTYAASGCGAVLALVSAGQLTYAASAFPVYAAAVCTLISVLIAKKYLRKHASTARIS